MRPFSSIWFRAPPGPGDHKQWPSWSLRRQDLISGSRTIITGPEGDAEGPNYIKSPTQKSCTVQKRNFALLQVSTEGDRTIKMESSKMEVLHRKFAETQESLDWVTMC